MDTTEKPVENNTHVPNVGKRTQTTWRKIASKKFDVQTADKILQLMQDHSMFTKKKKGKRNVSFLEGMKILGTYMGESSYASVAWRANTTNEDNKYRTLIENSIQLEANDWPKFQEHLKKLHSTEFYQSPAQQWGEIQCCSPNKNTHRIYHSNTNYF